MYDAECPLMFISRIHVWCINSPVQTLSFFNHCLEAELTSYFFRILRTCCCKKKNWHTRFLFSCSAIYPILTKGVLNVVQFEVTPITIFKLLTVLTQYALPPPPSLLSLSPSPSYIQTFSSAPLASLYVIWSIFTNFLSVCE
jgi:hypothetical protein